MKLNDFTKGTTKKFDVQITYNGNTPDITNDIVTLQLSTEKSSATASLTATADVSLSGSGGVAKFNLTPANTNITAQKYFYEINWSLTSGEYYVIDSGTVQVLERIVNN